MLKNKGDYAVKSGSTNHLSNIQMRNLKKYNDLQEGDGLFSGLSNLITPAVNFIESNADVITTGTQAISNVSTAGKNINNAINATKKLNAEIDQRKCQQQTGRVLLNVRMAAAMKALCANL